MDLSIRAIVIATILCYCIDIAVAAGVEDARSGMAFLPAEMLIFLEIKSRRILCIPTRVPDSSLSNLSPRCS
jgi:hypothetical protein